MFCFQILGNFPELFLVLIINLNSLSENILCMLWVLLNLLTHFMNDTESGLY